MSLYMFMASDYSMPLVNNSKIKYFKFKQGVKVAIDTQGKLYHYTNESDKDSPDLLIPCNADEAEAIHVDSEEDLHELQISTGHKSDDVKWYTGKNHVYTLDWRYTDERASQLLDYLKDNLNFGYEIELWLTWIDERGKPTKYYCDIKDLTINDIKEVFYCSSFEKAKCIVISKKDS